MPKQRVLRSRVQLGKRLSYIEERKKLFARELALAKGEIESLRQVQTRNKIGAQEKGQGGHVVESGMTSELSREKRGRVDTRTVGNQFTTANSHMREAVNMQRINIKSIAELLNTFDGTPRNFEAWEGQAKLLKEAYCLDDSKDLGRNATARKSQRVVSL